MNTGEFAVTLFQRLHAARVAPARSHVQMMLFLIGISLLTLGLYHHASAIGVNIESMGGSYGWSSSSVSEINYDDSRIAGAVATVFAFIEGSFGALVMVVSGLGAILSAAFGQYKSALGCLVVAVGAFILRSFVNTFFNVETLREDY